MDMSALRQPSWEIDRILHGCIGYDVRVCARRFAPVSTGNHVPAFLPVENIVLSDQSRPDHLPVLFEGKLDSFQRRIGVVRVCLWSPTLADTASDGLAIFRGKLTVIIRGPAVVELQAPFLVERLPADSNNYWQDLRMPAPQFELLF